MHSKLNGKFGGKLNKFAYTQAQNLLPTRVKSDSKVTGGRSLIIAGSAGMLGAAVLAATAAARVGSGYVILLTAQKKFASLKNPDFLVADWKTKKIADVKFSALAIGPGLGQSTQALLLLKQLLKLKAKNVVMDADALNLCAKKKLYPLPHSWIATPHEGELARLLETSAEHIRKNRISSLVAAQKKLGCIILLKGFRTLIISEKKIYEIQSGNRALAKAGTGDVLAGMITGFLAQGLLPRDAACLGAFVHGWMADQWVKEKKDYLSLLASDLLRALPQALNTIRLKKNPQIAKKSRRVKKLEIKNDEEN